MGVWNPNTPTTSPNSLGMVIFPKNPENPDSDHVLLTADRYSSDNYPLDFSIKSVIISV